MLSLYPDSTSTVSNPIRYFDALFSSDLLTMKKEGFYADDSKIIIEDDNPTSEIEYDEDFPVIHLGFVEVEGGYRYYRVEEYIPSEKISFDEKIDDELQEEFFKSKGLIDIFLKQQIPVEQAKLRCSLLIDNLQFLISKAEDDPELNYRTNYLEALIGYLLQKYPSLCPEYSESSNLFKIKLKKWSGKNVNPRYTLKSSFFNELVLLQFNFCG